MITLLRNCIALFRAARFIVHLGYGLGIAFFFPWIGARLRRRILQVWSRGLLQIFNVHIEIAAADPLHRLKHGLIVTNHISWLDVFVLNAVIPMRFVAKSEVRSWPVIGWLCARAQTLFIERGKARSAARINVHLVSLLQQGGCLAVFPEGTTTDGTTVAHFHSSLLQPAIDAAVPIHPIAIRYQDKRGAHNKAAAYIDEISFGTSLKNILCSPEIRVQLVGTKALDSHEWDRRSLTRMAHQHISETLHAMHLTSANSEHLPHTQAPNHPQDDLHFQSLYRVLLNPPQAQETLQHPTK